ncbi:hypothetical protein SAMN05661080_04450 [Modestobacter sp. DSM 44400]|uniref:hypothetical protein n=1 Tax=Modestobacter sp. DSM 44400 TaxID=1550230 RepID=UPI0008943E10|nr:hypothetical protein [Modestobacter sp. DSM 44400]SDY73704.1 hypothetical protein SAMN05661080_04450 [Modestobacter sp. DSM 44400]
MRSRTPLSRGEWGLVLFGVGGAIATVAAVVLAVVSWWPGDPATAFYLLRRGRCTMVEIGDAGHEVVLASLHP